MFTQLKIRQLVAIGFAVFFLFCSGVAHADSLFNGSYAVGNWTTTLTNSDGNVNTSLAPTSVTLTGGNNGSFLPGETLFSITAPTTATLSFNWIYSTLDCCGSVWDPAGYEIDGTKYQLSTNSAVPGLGGSGATTVNLTAGDTFGFYVDTVDNLEGPGILQVSGATSTPTPEPSTFVLLAVGLLGLVGLFRQRSRNSTCQLT